MRNLLLVTLVAALSGCAHEASLPGSFAEDALIQADSICHTFEVQKAKPRYTCFVSSRQPSGADASTPSGRAAIVSQRLAAVCGSVKVQFDELYRADSTSGTATWRLYVQCQRS